MSEPPINTNGWGEYRRLILSELERIGRDIGAINSKIDRLREEDISQVKMDITLLKFQAAMWGGGAGIIFGAIATVILKVIASHY